MIEIKITEKAHWMRLHRSQHSAYTAGYWQFVKKMRQMYLGSKDVRKDTHAPNADTSADGFCSCASIPWLQCNSQQRQHPLRHMFQA